MDASFGPVNPASPPSGGATGPTSLRGSLGEPGALYTSVGVSQAEAFRLIERMTELDLTAAEAARLLGLKTRELTRLLRRGAPLLPVEDGAEHLLLLRQLSAWGAAIFGGDQGKFNRWLRRPLGGLAGESPLSLLDTDTGLQLVRQELGRLAHGVYG
jgi:putative toxin-antitoxin system antitoxin component (TIGR02293 family)